MNDTYQLWLVAQGYNENTCNTQIAHVRQIERYYGDLEEIIANGGLDGLVAEFTYTLADERAEKANPTKVEFSGRTYTRLQSLKGAVKRYARFLSEGFEPEAEQLEDVLDDLQEIQKADKQRLALERDMQRALRDDIASLDPSFEIVDDGAERTVESGFIDILCKDGSGCLVVLELKAGKTNSRVVGQILGYMGDLLEEGEGDEVRGIIVAHSFDKRTLSAARAIPNLKLVSYSINFTFVPQR